MQSCHILLPKPLGHMRSLCKFPLLLCTLLLQSCKVGPNYKAPEVDLPSSFTLGGGIVSTQPQPSREEPFAEKQWWLSFNNPSLNSLVAEALLANADILTAMSNVSKAQAELSLGQSYLLPNINLEASATKSKNSKNLPAQNRGTLTKNSGISAIATYEIDLWGKVSHANEAAKAAILGAQSNVDAVKLTVLSGVVSGYFNMVALDEQIAITRQLISIQEELLKITAAQVRHGIADDLALSAAESDLASSEATLPPLEQQLQEQETALAILLGKSPRALMERSPRCNGTLSAIPIPPSAPKVLPSELLTRRPDIRAAEENLKSANAMIGVAKAAYFPSLSLSALIGLSSSNIDNLFNRHSRTYEIAKSTSLPIFDFGATRANVKIAKIAKDQAMIQYALIVRAAFGDVVTALAAVDSSKWSYIAAEKNESAIARAMNLTEQRYNHGVAAYSGVLSAKESLLQAKLKTIDARLGRLEAAAGLFGALGGGY